MSTITVVTVDAGGNVPPALRVADELARRGHRIEVLGHRRQADAVARVGHAFRALDSLDFWDSGVRRSVPVAIGQAARLAADRDLEREVREAVSASGSNVALVDGLMASCVQGAQAAGAPAAVLFHTFLDFWERSYRRGPAGVVARLRGTDPLPAWAHAAARIVASDVALDPASARRTALALGAEWVGTIESGVPATPDAAAPPLVVVSLSTTWFPGQTDAYQRIATALGALPVRGLITLGGLAPDRGLRLPPNVELRERVDHDEVFPEASILIGHGGHSTAFRALAYGLPVLLMPMHPMLDQPMVARSIERAGAGRALGRTAPPERIAAAVTALLADDRARAEASALGERIRATDAAGAAADAVERLARAGSERPTPAA
ncbi:MAG TPA: nucleotide disphospho-sugar-binding domain-containing protein [Agromyces sp.]